MALLLRHTLWLKPGIVDAEKSLSACTSLFHLRNISHEDGCPGNGRISNILAQDPWGHPAKIPVLHLAT